MHNCTHTRSQFIWLFISIVPLILLQFYAAMYKLLLWLLLHSIWMRTPHSTYRNDTAIIVIAFVDMISEGDIALWLQYFSLTINWHRQNNNNKWTTDREIERERERQKIIILKSIVFVRYEVIRVDKICINSNLCTFHLVMRFVAQSSEDSDISTWI